MEMGTIALEDMESEDKVMAVVVDVVDEEDVNKRSYGHNP